MYTLMCVLRWSPDIGWTNDVKTENARDRMGVKEKSAVRYRTGGTE